MWTRFRCRCTLFRRLYGQTIQVTLTIFFLRAYQRPECNVASSYTYSSCSEVMLCVPSTMLLDLRYSMFKVSDHAPAVE